ncbi:hypothetical protein TIFTF001_007830 [Ficus carica]|uniref:Uncharacterized protein n=1 Tax=Ficus carica TaxID=3494 RepID=A0AA87ZK96_FICCA|nr:hypothetical protein TIFTF001_007830 [Ficus carica]
MTMEVEIGHEGNGASVAASGFGFARATVSASASGVDFLLPDEAESMATMEIKRERGDQKKKGGQWEEREGRRE